MKELQMTGPIYTHRTRNGLSARILCTDFVDIDINKPVIVAIKKSNNIETLHFLFSDLTVNQFVESAYDLFECSPWDDVAMDMPVYVRDYEYNPWIPRHFAYYHDGNVYVFQDGKTYHTSTQNAHAVPYKYAKLKSEMI